MAIERKCPSCYIWNKDNDYCTSCGVLISPQIIEEKREAIRQTRRNSILPTKLEVFLKKWENSRFLLLRIIYKILYYISFTFIAIASFFAYLAATPNG